MAGAASISCESECSSEPRKSPPGKLITDSSKVRKSPNTLRRWGVQTGKGACDTHNCFLH